MVAYAENSNRNKPPDFDIIKCELDMLILQYVDAEKEVKSFKQKTRAQDSYHQWMLEFV